MLIDLSKMEELGSQKNITGQLNFDNLNFQQREIKTPDPLKVDLTIYKGEESFIFTGKLSGKIILQCSRCLQQFPLNIELDIEQEVVNNEIADLNSFNLNELLKTDIFLAVPIKPLCEEECSGLCSHCGQNLNEKKCDCNEEQLDPRMAKLKELYKNSEEEVD